MQIAMLGPLEVRTDTGAPVEVGGARLRTLMILLALDAGRVATTRRLIDGVWDDDPPAGAANALQALVSRLRRVLPDGAVESHPAGYRLAVEPDAVDVRRFQRLVAAGRAAVVDDAARAADLLREALSLWRGPALVDVADARFARAPIARLTELRLAAFEDRSDAELARGAGASLVAELEALVAEHLLRERPVGQLMRALCAAGRPAEALAAYDRLRTALADQLGVDPSPALAALHLAVLRGELVAAPAVLERSPVGDLSGTAPAPSTGEERRTNLRAALTSFVGRDEDVARVAKLVGESRLATLTGPGGAGKTRLAVESARTLLDQTPDGVWLVELAPVTDPGEVAHAVLASLGLREQALLQDRRPRGVPVSAADPLDRLTSALRDKRALLVLDNCEHIIQTAADLADRLLGACPSVRILATSREPLGITGETLWPVEPLSLPPSDVDASGTMEYASVRLLVDRAAAVRPGFTVDGQNVSAVVRICRALDGMPLAIELAAARLRTMTPDQVAARLDDRFRLLTGGSRTALPRHQTLRAVVDWSWELLDDAERALLRRLAVFSGGATLEAVERVCGGSPVPPHDVLDLLTALVDKSLLVVGGQDGQRYGMLETIRAYGLDRLAEAGEMDRLREAHAAQFLQLAESADPHLRRGDQILWLNRLADEHDNLHGALRWSIATGRAGIAVRLTGALGWYWWLRGHRAEGADLAAAAALLPGDVPDEERALAYTYAAVNALAGNHDLPTIKTLFDRAIGLIPDSPSRHPLLRLLRPIARIVESQWGEAAAEGLVGLFDDAEPWLRGFTKTMHAHLLLNMGRDSAAAEGEFVEALGIFRELGERWGTSFALGALAELAGRRGDHAASVAYQEEGLRRITELGTNEDLPQTQVWLAHQLWLLGERERAMELLAEALRIAERIGVAEAAAAVQYELSIINRTEGDRAKARACLMQADGLIRSVHIAPQFRAMIGSSLGYLDAAEGDLLAARARHREALEQALSSYDAPIIALTSVGLADLALHEGEPARAAALLGAADGIRGGPDRSLADTPRVEAATRAALGEADFAEAYARGRLSTVDTLRELAGLTPSA